MIHEADSCAVMCLPNKAHVDREVMRVLGSLSVQRDHCPCELGPHVFQGALEMDSIQKYEMALEYIVTEFNRVWRTLAASHGGRTVLKGGLP